MVNNPTITIENFLVLFNFTNQIEFELILNNFTHLTL